MPVMHRLEACAPEYGIAARTSCPGNTGWKPVLRYFCETLGMDEEEENLCSPRPPPSKSYLHQLILPGPQAQLFGVFQLDGPVDLGVDVFEFIHPGGEVLELGAGQAGGLVY